MHAGTCGPGLDLVSLLSNAQVQPWGTQTLPPQVGWHFPVGPGLGQMVHCPSWQDADISYYPALEDSAAFQVEWRVWEEVTQSPTSASPGGPQRFDFTVMSYNILSQDLLEMNQHLYSHCPLQVLEWSYRYWLLLGEIRKWRPDILCLQEVQEDHFNEQLHPDLTQMGYACVYKRRTGGKTDGCAVCYRGDRFQGMSESLLEFLRPEMELLDRDNVGVVLLLQPISIQGSQVTHRGRPLCVANTHLLFNPGRGDVKLAQLALVLAEIHRVVRSCEGGQYNVVLCGDFNSVPQQPLYQLITTGALHYQGMPAWKVSGQQDMSHKTHPHRMLAPLWPRALGITDNCQYVSAKSTEHRHTGKVQYDHAFLRQFQFCPSACVRPDDLALIPGVTDSTPGTTGEDMPSYHSVGVTRGRELILNINIFRSSLNHFLELRSAYTHVQAVSGRPEVTTLHREGASTVDYIFYTPTSVSACKTNVFFLLCVPVGGLKLVSRLALLSEEDLWSMKGLPNETFPSDHLSLLAHFQLELE
ncbi:protein angel homolog 1 [Aplochiton taeniatus]